ncbi:MAG: aminoglycoside phosphotransferase family protein [Magnetococcales bacterium]|nr:aminoglycoside phosphotransferase family protein [Magnetococcales bacterium]
MSPSAPLLPLTAIAQELAQAPIQTLSPMQAGGNNPLYRVETAEKTFALKFYPPQASDPRDRLGRETAALALLNRSGLTATPKLIGVDRHNHCALFSWIDGQTIPHPTAGDIDQALVFIQALRDLTLAPDSSPLPPASDAVLSGQDLLDQLHRRYDRLADLPDPPPSLTDFLENDFSPALNQFSQRARQIYQQAGLDISSEITPSQRLLSPSDFGFHNALRQRDGRIVFLDFEYFGWDDPVKLTCDFSSHPGMELAPALQNHYRRQMQEMFATDDHFAIRLQALHPLLELCWMLIMLNEFLPDVWARRAKAQGVKHQQQASKQQLHRVKKRFQQLTESSHD